MAGLLRGPAPGARHQLQPVPHPGGAPPGELHDRQRRGAQRAGRGGLGRPGSAEAAAGSGRPGAQRPRALRARGPRARHHRPAVAAALLAVWQLSFILGFALLLWPINGTTFWGALRESGSSFFTLGFTATDTPPATVVIFFSAATGLISVALLIGYLPTLYGAFNRREKLITTLEARAGVPAWGPEILVRQVLVGLLDSLPGLYEDWEEWAADLSETHSNYPILIRFRSPSPYRSWIVGLIAVLDSAALYLAFCPERAPTAARLVLRQGSSALRDIAVAVRLPMAETPAPTTRSASAMSSSSTVWSGCRRRGSRWSARPRRPGRTSAGGG